MEEEIWSQLTDPAASRTPCSFPLWILCFMPLSKDCRENRFILVLPGAAVSVCLYIYYLIIFSLGVTERSHCNTTTSESVWSGNFLPSRCAGDTELTLLHLRCFGSCEGNWPRCLELIQKLGRTGCSIHCFIFSFFSPN